MPMLNKNKLIDMLRQHGIEVKGNRISKDEFNKVFSSLYTEPEWMVSLDYDLEGSAEKFIGFINSEELKIDRTVSIPSYSMAKFGVFSLPKEGERPLFGFVYQYSLKNNPRNVHYAYRLFFGVRNVSKNAGFSSLQHAKNECCNEAKHIIENKLK